MPNEILPLVCALDGLVPAAADPIAVLDELDKPFAEQLEAIAQEIGYGRSCQILGELWDRMLVREGIPPGRGALERRLDIEAVEAGYVLINQAARVAINALSQRQREMILMIAEGVSQEEIARRLGVHVNTVRVRCSQAYAHLGVHTAREASVLAVQAGLVAGIRMGETEVTP